jgi:hypothetical protein
VTVISLLLLYANQFGILIAQSLTMIALFSDLTLCNAAAAGRYRVVDFSVSAAWRLQQNCYKTGESCEVVCRQSFFLCSRFCVIHDMVLPAVTIQLLCHLAPELIRKMSRKQLNFSGLLWQSSLGHGHVMGMIFNDPLNG